MHGYRAAVLILWLAGGIGAYGYSQFKDIPPAVAVPVALAFLIELTLYFANGSETARARWARLGVWLPWALTASAITPWLLYSLATGKFSWGSLGTLVSLAGVVAFWYLLAPGRPWVDVLFLVFMAGIVLAKVFRSLYESPVEGLRMEALGQLMWIRMGIFSVLVFRRAPGIGFGFLPDRRDWIEGLRYFLLFAPVGVALAAALRFAEFRPSPDWWWKAP
ncbi:MAG: hypothetical protein ACRD44_13760, partial [Bryobacteraceae bacterium]